jgi:glutaredoxin
MKRLGRYGTGASLVAVGLGLLVGLIFLLSPEARASYVRQGSHKVTIYLFWGDGCPHCATEKRFLEEWVRSNPHVEVREYEVWYVQENQQLFIQMASAFGFEPTAVPTTFIGNRYWVGYSEAIQQEIQAVVEQCLASGCPDAGQGIVPGSPAAEPAPAAAEPAAGPEPAATPASLLTLPLLGAVDLTAQSLLASTALIAFVDGFNPCSLWVLSILLALALHTGSRQKVFLVGLVFLTVTAAIYALFITGLFTMFTFVSFLGWIQGVVALVALFFAAVSIKDYFWFRQGVSFTIADEHKPGIYQGIRRVLGAGQSWGGMVGATVVLAAGVSLVEIPCTAGFPILWTHLLIGQEVEGLVFGLLLLLYMLIYLLDELGLFVVAVVTLRAGKLEEKYGRLLKLVGGMLMLTLAVVMLVEPAWMSELSTSLGVFGAAFGLTLLVLLVHRLLLPRLGVYVGSELRPPKARKRLRRQRV